MLWHHHPNPPAPKSPLSIWNVVVCCCFRKHYADLQCKWTGESDLILEKYIFIAITSLPLPYRHFAFLSSPVLQITHCNVCAAGTMVLHFPLIVFCSHIGKRLMAKCRLLLNENEELGRTISSGSVAKLESTIALEKKFTQEMKKTEKG